MSKNDDDENSPKDPEVNEALVKKISEILLLVIEQNKTLDNYKEKLASQKEMSFTSYNKPSLSVKDYLIRIATYSEAEDSTMILSLIYIDRISEISSVILTPYNVHRLMFVSLLTAIKYNEDVCFGFSFYANVAGVPVKELRKLERDFIDLLQFKLFVKNEEFEKYRLSIEEMDSEE